MSVLLALLFGFGFVGGLGVIVWNLIGDKPCGSIPYKNTQMEDDIRKQTFIKEYEFYRDIGKKKD